MPSIWNQVIAALENRIPSEQIQEWLAPTEIIEENEKRIVAQVPNDLFSDWIKENYLDDIYVVLKEAGFDQCNVQFVNRNRARNTAVEPAAQVAAVPVNDQALTLEKLNTKYRFESFVVGSSNQFAHAAALAVAEAPSASYNPLYLYGSSGLGKTHLLHAIGFALIENKPQLKICYTTCEEFTNMFINSIRFNKGEAFRERYRSVDVLLIDDIQFLSGKMQTQEEFFHTFNALYEQQKQIILSSDCAPSDIPKLESRLTSRFQMGLIADIQPPALETRIAILRKKAESEKVFLSDDVVLFIANKVKTNVRQLEGALVKLMAYAALGNRLIDLELAEECLSNFVRDETEPVDCEKIKRFIAEQFQIHPKELCAKNNAKRIAQPRQIAMYLTRQMTGMSLPEIGVAFGNKHHSTVLYSIQKIEKQMAKDPDTHSRITGFQKSLG